MNHDYDIKNLEKSIVVLNVAPEETRTHLCNDRAADKIKLVETWESFLSC